MAELGILCTSYAAYVTSIDEDTVTKIIEELSVMASARKKKGIALEKLSGTTSRVYVLRGVYGPEVAKLGLIPYGGKGGDWLVPFHKVAMVRYFAATGTMLQPDKDLEIDDRKFFDHTLNKMAKAGLMYSSLRPVDRGVFDDVFQRPPNKVIPEPQTYKAIMSYIN